MADEQMWIGTKGREQWMACPLIDADVSRIGWSSSTQLLSGEVSMKQSVNAHRAYNFEWKADEPAARQYLMDLADHLYDDGSVNGDLIYFGDPTTMQINALPPSWAAPFVQAIDAPTTMRTRRPTMVATQTNTFGLPVRSAAFPSPDPYATARPLYIPIPPGYRARWAFYGDATGWNPATNVVNVTHHNGTGTAAATPLQSVTAYGTGWTTSLSGATGITLTMNLAAGPFAVSAGILQVYPVTFTPATPTKYLRGWGNAGCVIEDKPTLSIGALSRFQEGARLVEVGAHR